MKKIVILVVLVVLVLLVVGVSLAEETNVQIFIPVVLMDPTSNCRYWYTNGGIAVSCDGMDPNLYPGGGR